MSYAVDLDSLRPLAEKASREVGGKLRQASDERRKYKINYKGQSDIFTELDIWAEEELSKALLSALPGSTIIGEERAANLSRESDKSVGQLFSSGCCWIVDPIDGTNNFCNHIPHYAISIGLLIDSEIVLGVVYDPMRDELFSATVGAGATLNGNKIFVSDTTRIEDSIAAISFPVTTNQMQPFWTKLERIVIRSRASRVTGSAALDICWVADGRIDAAVLPSLAPWDVAAGALIVREAGGFCGNYPEQGEFSITASCFIFCGSKLRTELLNVLS
jgi:myo-inositol-1(or 4)-monophosphatase